MSIKCSEVVNFNICKGYYSLISKMLEEELKYILDYKIILSDYFKKSLNLQVNLGTKLGNPPEEFKNATWLDYAPILILTQQIPKIIQMQIENNKTFIDEIEKNVKNIDLFLKDKSKSMKKFEEKYQDVNNALIKRYIDAERAKISYLNSIGKTEDIISKYYDNKKKLDMAQQNNNINNNKPGEDMKSLIDKNKEYESLKKSLIKDTKKLENEYIDIVKNSFKYEDKFIKQLNECIEGMKNVSLEITDQIKEIVLIFSNTLKDSFKAPLNIIENNIKDLTSTNVKENMNNAILKTFNKEQKFTYIIPSKYELKSLIIVDNYESRFSLESKGSKGSKGSKSSKKAKKKRKESEWKSGMVKFEDGFEEMTYFEDDATLYTAKEIFDNFQLIITNGINIKDEFDKNTTKNLISKILSIMQESDPNGIAEDSIITEEEKNQLKALLNVHSNRVIFMHKLNDYRSLCLYELQDYFYKLLGDLFTYIIDVSVKESDYHSVEMVIILSKTYYISLDKKTKLYLQDVILNHQCFKSKDFWEALLIYSISKELIQSNKRDSTEKDDEKKIKTKNDNIVFSQLLSLIDNMFDFGVDENLIKAIIEPKLEFYKVDEKLTKTILDVMDSKIKAKNKGKK